MIALILAPNTTRLAQLERGNMVQDAAFPKSDNTLQVPTTTMPDSPHAEAQDDTHFHLSNANSYLRAYNKNKDEASLEGGISAAEMVLKHAPQSSEESLQMTWKLAHLLGQRYEQHQGEIADLERSIQLFRTWTQDAPDDHCELPFVMCLLAGALSNRFKVTDNRRDLEEALELAKSAVCLSSLDPSYHLVYLRTVQEQLTRMWKSFGEPNVLDKVIQARRDVLEESTKRKDGELWRDLDDLERALSQRFEKTGRVADLQEALPLARAACEGMPDGFPRECNMLSHLSCVLAKSVEVGLLPSSGLDESIELLRTAISMEPIETRDRVGLLVNLTLRHKEAYTHGRGVQALHLAIEFGKEVLELTPLDDPERPNHYQDLAICIKSLFEYNGEPHLLDEAIEMYRQALAYTHLPDDDKAYSASNLSIALKNRYETSAAEVDLEEAVSAARCAVAGWPVGHQYHSVALNTLGTSLSARYTRFKNPDDLDEAIECAREAARCSWDKSDAGMYYSNISTKLSKRYEDRHAEEDRWESLEFARKAVAATPSSRQQTYAMYNNNLATRLYAEYLISKRVTPSMEYLEEAMRLSKIALQYTPKSHVDWSDYAYWLGWRQMEFATIASDEETGWLRYDEGIDTFRTAFMAEGASPIQRLNAGRIAALMLLTRARWQDANEISREALKLLSHASPRSMSRSDMQHRLSGLSNLSTFAAVAALNSGQQPAEALALLEQGRGLIAGLLIGSRTDISSLHATDPQVATEYKGIMEELSRKVIVQDGEDVVRNRRNIMKRLESLEGHIRTLPGLSRFQLPASDEQLKELASAGPLVCFNVTGFRSDAFIITTETVELLPLPLLLESDLKREIQNIVGKTRITMCGLTQRNDTNVQLSKTLRWLWNVAVKPVMDHLKLSSKPDTRAADLPRIWWVGSGYMGLMPLHAAGSGWETSGENTASHVVSSQVHTLKALAFSRERSQSSDRARRSVLAVDSPSIREQGWAALNTAPELAAIRRAAESAGIPSTTLSQPRVASVLEEMGKNSMIHFACHGDPDLEDPSQMSLILCKDEHTVDRLTVAQLFDEKHDHAELAYLSACCTAQQNSIGLLDEGIHLGNVFQLMGFPAVVATLWEADDEAAAQVAEFFYRRFLGDDSDDGVARCLHNSLMDLRATKLGRRKRKSDDILAWAPFIHIGL